MKNKFSKKTKHEDIQVCVRSVTLSYPLGDPDPRCLKRKKSIKTIQNDYQIWDLLLRENLNGKV